ncbi:preprotein translocase subunit YajC, partial [Pseudomonas putida]
RAKEQKNLLSNLQKGDEVVTNGGIAGKIVKVSDDFVVLEVSDTVELKFQKGAIAATLPKGTLKAI